MVECMYMYLNLHSNDKYQQFNVTQSNPSFFWLPSLIYQQFFLIVLFQANNKQDRD